VFGKTSLSLTHGDNAFSEEPFRFFLFYHRTMNFCFFVYDGRNKSLPFIPNLANTTHLKSLDVGFDTSVARDRFVVVIEARNLVVRLVMNDTRQQWAYRGACTAGSY
jgi:hypothetical protein